MWVEPKSCEIDVSGYKSITFEFILIFFAKNVLYPDGPHISKGSLKSEKFAKNKDS